MKKFFTGLSFTLLLCFSTVAFGQAEAQTGPKPSLDNGTIQSQFDYLYRKSSSYQEYKVVKKTSYQKIKGNVLDSLQVLKKELVDTKKLVEVQGNEIKSLKADLQTTNDNLTSVTKEKDNIKFLGFPMTKTGYNSLLWTIIFSILALLLFFIFRFKSSITVAVWVAY